ncbi:hypothetical protein BJX62DRAFT_240354 [Aspergillus germanicus]
MQYPSKIALAAVAFASTVGLVTAAPAVGFGNNTAADNETVASEAFATLPPAGALWVAAQTPTALMTIVVKMVGV